MDVSVGDATKETDYDQLVANVEYLQTLADAEHNFHISTGTGYHKAMTVAGTMTVGVNDAGYDVKFWGDTADKSMLWDTSADKLIITGDAQCTGTATGFGGAALTGSTNNTVTTVTGANAFQGEANLTFDGTTLDVVGNAGVGIARTEGTMHVHTATAGGVTANTSADDLVIENSGTGGLSVLTPNDALGYVMFGDEDSNNRGGMYYTHSSDQLSLYTSAGAIQSHMWSSGTIGINETANANMTLGLTINQGANDDQIFALKSSDVAHGRTGLMGETDTYFLIQKNSADTGGVSIWACEEAGSYGHVMYFHAEGSDMSTTQSTASSGLIDFFCQEHNGSNGKQNCTAEGVAYTFRATDSGGNQFCKFLIDEDGDFRYDGADGGAFDVTEELGEVDDVALCRAYDLHASDPKTVIKTRWDEFVAYNREDLTKAGILSEVSAEDAAAGHRPMVSGRQIDRLHNGAIWQLHVGQEELREYYEERISQLETQVTRLLEN